LIYNNIHKGIFRSRPNRFIAEVEIDGRLERCHVKNTGRCKELLVPGAVVYLNQTDNPNRTTKYDLVAVYKGSSLVNADGLAPNLVNIDSQAPNHVFREYLQAGRYIDGITTIKPEAKYGSSRFDFYIETNDRKIFIEVKGVTLEKDGIALFPDAPTQRGIKHLNELAQCIQDGFEAHVVFIIQLKSVRHFTPNYETHPEFGAALIKAHAAGVKISALDCIVTSNSLTVDCLVPIMLDNKSNL